jgi:hypothetical protein
VARREGEGDEVRHDHADDDRGRLGLLGVLTLTLPAVHRRVSVALPGALPVLVIDDSDTWLEVGAERLRTTRQAFFGREYTAE